MNKNLICMLMVLALCTCTLFGCSKSSSSFGVSGRKISVVCTIFPLYDWVKQIVGTDNDSIEITLLLDNGVDLHSYQPTIADIAQVSDCDLFLYVGGESDGWVEDVLTEATNKNMKVINLLEVLGDSVKEEEIVEGMEAEEETEYDAGKVQEEEGAEYDEHVWLSLKKAGTICSDICDVLSEIDSENAMNYEENRNSYIAELDALDKEYQDVVESAARKTILFGDRFPFRYMVDDYGLSYYAAFVGCSAETEASFNTIAFLAGKVNEEKLPAIFTIETSDQSIAEAIKENTTDENQPILVLNSLQSVTSEDIKAGTVYLSVMKVNLEVLKKALN